MVRTRYWLASRGSRLFALSMARPPVVNETSRPDAGLPAASSVAGRLRTVVDPMRHSGVFRAAVCVVGIMAAPALQPGPGRPVDVTSVRARILVPPPQAQRYLSLQYRS